MIEVNGIRFHVRDEGSGTPVILLHGFPDTGELWRHQVAALGQRGFRTIVPDMRGRGRSDKPEGVENYGLSLITQDVTGILDALGVERAHVVGHDWGAGVAWLVASLAPQRVDRLVAISVGFPYASGRPDLEALQKGWYRLLIQFPDIAEELFQRDDWFLMRELLQGGGDVDANLRLLAEPGALTAGFNWYRANGRVERLLGPGPQLPPVSAPVLGIWSSGDHYLSERQMRASEKAVTGPWRYERIEGASHWIPLDAADRLNELLLDFLS